MAKLEELTVGTAVRGLSPNGIVTLETVKWHGDSAIEVIFTDALGGTDKQIVYRDQEPTLEIASTGRPWSFDADGHEFKLASEAHRISLAYLFDPLLAVHTSAIEPLPHQITAVYQAMLPRQPLRFLLADDPGAGKTIMTGLLVKELIARGDIKRCMIVCPGNLVEQWQDELSRKFHLHFDIMTNEGINAASTGNWFLEHSLVLCRLDKLSRNEDIQEKLAVTDWDLIVCDEAHKMSATYFGNELKETKRHKLGKRLSEVTRHFLLLTATPHNGKEEDFQLFMALLDGDRFEGKFRTNAHTADCSDLMRRLVKEKLLKFDGTRLFPERRAYTVNYDLSDPEAQLYKEVTEYVRNEFNRADELDKDRRGTVGFALTILQRRLASSPEAIYRSLVRRKERLERRVEEEKLLRRGAILSHQNEPRFSQDDLEDLEDAPEVELEEVEDKVLDLATTARTIAELEAEIVTLKGLEKLANDVRRSGTDRKWEELSRLLQDNEEMFDAQGHRRKLVVFTEHLDTLHYLATRIRTLLGDEDAVVTIQGGMLRDDRRNAEERFTQDKGVQVLVATDAAGEGINLQRAHLMVNYDLPWNPNRIEQRFGRIHRIGQTEICHLWNLVASETREGEVYLKLLRKLENASAALGGQVFDVLGSITFHNRSLRDLLIEAIRRGESPEVQSQQDQEIDTALDIENLRRLLEEKALTSDTMSAEQVFAVREQMERAEARRLQPHFISEFFREAFTHLGGTMHEREPKRYEITHVPGPIRSRDRVIGVGYPIMKRYERVTFERTLINVPKKPNAAFVCPGHPLMDATCDLILERYRDRLRQGAILIDPEDESTTVRALLYLEHAIHDGRTNPTGGKRVISKRLQFVELDREQHPRGAGAAPFLEYRPVDEAELKLVTPLLEQTWLNRNLEDEAKSYAIASIVPEHLGEVKQHKEKLIDKAKAEVHKRLTAEITHWDHRAQQLKAQEEAGKQPKINAMKARERAQDLSDRLQRRLKELDQERHLASAAPVVIGGALIVPIGVIQRLKAGQPVEVSTFGKDRDAVEQAAMDAVIAKERALGYEPRDVSDQNLGYDVESRVPGNGTLRFIEVKGRQNGADTVTVTKNEILAGLNKPENFILAIVLVDGNETKLHYIPSPFEVGLDFAETSSNFNIRQLLEKAVSPA
jgi:superfamily II DNA or RNA helicase